AAAAQFIALRINPGIHNKGFEAVTYDPASDRLFAIKERAPRQLFEVAGVQHSIDQGRLQIKVADRLGWITKSVAARALSDGYYDPRTGHLLLLSDQAHSITELDSKGRCVSTRTRLATFSDPKPSAPQPEGLTTARPGNLHVVSRPNLACTLSQGPAHVGNIR
ncbi:SdiA-regulated, partial [Pseudomonas syringae]